MEGVAIDVTGCNRGVVTKREGVAIDRGAGGGGGGGVATGITGKAEAATDGGGDI